MLVWKRNVFKFGGQPPLELEELEPPPVGAVASAACAAVVWEAPGITKVRNNH